MEKNTKHKKGSHPGTFGVTSMGERGQVVIPADIRDTLKLEKGEKLVALARGGGVTLIPASRFEHMAERLTEMRELFDIAVNKR